RHPWAWLLQRVFAVDVMTCPRCRGAMKLVENANEREAIARRVQALPQQQGPELSWFLALVGLGHDPPLVLGGEPAALGLLGHFGIWGGDGGFKLLGTEGRRATQASTMASRVARD